MQKINKRQGLMLCAAGLLVAVMLTIFIRFGVRQILVKRAHMDNFITQTVFCDNGELCRIETNEENKIPEIKKTKKIDWEGMYPFHDNVNVKTIKCVTAEKIERKTASIKKKIDDWTGKNLFAYYNLAESGRSYEKMIMWELIQPQRNIVPLGNDVWSFADPSVKIQERCMAIVNLSHFVENNGSKFLYIQAPFKVDPQGDVGVNGITDFSNQNMDSLLEQLHEHGIVTLDLRQNLRNWVLEEDVDWHSFFFRTDHHWKPETALRVAKVVADEINEYGIDVDDSYYDLQNFEVEVLPDWFLGSQGKKVTLSQTSPDDFSILHPKFKTQVHFEVPELGIDEVGDFEVTYDKEAVARRDLYNLEPYGMYGHSSRAVVNIENLMLPKSDKKVLIIRDSFCNVMGPFLGLGVRNVMLLDVRFFTGSVEKYISIYNPDLVILMYTSTSLLSEPIDWSTHKDFFDFR